MNTNTQNVAKTLGSYTLRHIRRTLEAEMLASVAANETGTQMHVGKLEMLAAVGAELDARGELLDPPPFMETDLEDGRIRLSYSVRVF